MALYHRFKRQFLSHVQVVRIVLLVLIVGGSSALWWFFIRPLSSKTQTIFNSYNTQLPSVSGRTNFLLLGVAGGEHDGADLTDTIIFVSVDSVGKVTLVSVPRDIWIPSMRAKINTAFHYGSEKKSDGGGFQLAKSAVTEAIGQPIQFVAMINFANFEKVIDAMGGIDINVDKAFDDYEFPIPGKENDLCDGDLQYKCRYEHLHFDAGVQHMDGATVLKYVRSRHAEGNEGTDFARSHRQEKLLLALKDKVISGGVFSNPKQLKALYGSLAQAITTDFTPDLYPALVKLGLKVVKTNSINTYTLSVPDHLYNPPISSKFDFQWVLLPKSDNWKVISDFVTELLNK